MDPLLWSKIHDDYTSIRLVHFQQIAGTDILIIKGRLESAGFAAGLIKEDENSEMDLRMMSIGTFVERKLAGRVESYDNVIKKNEKLKLRFRNSAVLS